jgi:hypothetical protein
LGGDEKMTTLTCNHDTVKTDQSIVQAVESYGLAASAALYYPSLEGNCWDDELLPSGD